MHPNQQHTTVDGPRRTALAQDRSKRTRRRLVRAAVELWTERGFEGGVDETTVTEIAELAGVTKGTFYFHFAHKDDIFLELGWGTAEALYEEAVRGAVGSRSGTALVHQLLTSLARRVESVPRPAVLRAVRGFYARSSPTPVPGRRNIHHAIAVALEVAAARGELPEGCDTEELARMITALAMDTCLLWASGEIRRLRGVLLSHTDLVLAGAEAAVTPRPGASRNRRSAT